MKKQYWLITALTAVVLCLSFLAGGVNLKASGEAKLSTTTSAVIGDRFELRLGFEEGTYEASELTLLVSKRFGDEVIEPEGGVFRIPLNPEELTLDLNPRLMYGDTELDRRTAPYSGALYAKTLAEFDGMSDDVREMLADLLEYGAAAQNYYGYRTDDLANDAAYRWDGYTPSAFTAPNPDDVVLANEGSGIRIRSANLFLYGDTIAVQFRGFATADAVYTLNGTAVTPTSLAGGSFLIRTAPIQMSAMHDAAYTLRVSDGTNASEVTYSVANYIANKTNDVYMTAGNQYMAELAKRLWAYGEQAKYVYENMTVQEFTIRFLDVDGTVISEHTYASGEAISAPDQPVKTANGYTYTANGWGKPVPAAAAENADYQASYKAGDIVLDFDWYGDGSADTFVLEDPEDLFAFALISQTKNFAGKTVKLGADIDLNPAWTASAAAPANVWVSAVSNTSVPFAGTFDGQGHTIKGIYFNASAETQGFFRQTTANAVLQNFYLKNSYMKVNTGSAGANGFGSIVGLGAGTFRKIYSAATVDAYLQRVGGLIGKTNGIVTMEDCWFAGKADIRTNSSYIGGLIGDVVNNTTIANSMNTAAVTLNASPGTTGVGGFIGHIAGGVTVAITDSVNHGKPSQTKATDGMLGLLVGYKQGALTLQNCHSILYKGYQDANNLQLVGDTSSDPSGCSRQNQADVAGTKSLTTANVSALFSSDTARGHWVCSSDSLPILAAFADEYAGGAILLDTDWYDESQTEYVLADAADFYGFAALSQTNVFTGKTVKLGADIDLNPDCTASLDGMSGTPEAWAPIGSVSKPFAGTFDGQGHTISGLYLNASTGYQGLFSATEQTAVIRDFKLKNSYLATTSAQIGSIVGNAKGTFEKIYSEAIVLSTGTVQAGTDKGGLVGGLIGATSTAGTLEMAECQFAGKARITGQASYMGGLIGRAANTATNIANCLNTGELCHTWSGALSTAGVGGLVSFAANKVTLTISDSVNHTRPQYTAGSFIGLFVSKTDTNAVVNLTNGHSIVYKYNDNVTNMSLVYGTADNTYATCSRQNQADVAGTKSLTTAKVSALFSSDTAKGHWVCSTDSLPILAVFADEYAGGAIMMDTSWYDASQSEYVLMDADDLYGFAALSQTNPFTGKTVKLGADIDVNPGWTAGTEAPERIWLKIGTLTTPFAGTFDGQGHTIRGIFVNEAAQYEGLFGVTESTAVIRDFKLKNSYFTNGSYGYLGSIAGLGKGAFEKIYSDAIVDGKGTRIGGLIGLTSSASGITMRDCWFAGSATISATASYLGGLIGHVAAASTIENCLNTGEVYHKASVSTAGTACIVGYASAVVTMKNCVNHKNPAYTKGSGVGYFIGTNAAASTVENCHSINWYNKKLVGDTENTNYPTCSVNNTGVVAGLNSKSVELVKNLFTDESAVGHWVCTNDSLPVLSYFAAEYPSGTISE